MAPSKVLLVGGTGYLGKYITKASVRLGHPTFVLVRDTNPSDPAKAALLKSLEDAGATLVQGDLYDHASLVKAMKQADVVISVVGGAQTTDQVKLLDAAKEAGTIKRILPSEFGNDVDKVEVDLPILAPVFNSKADVRRAVEKSGIPYTYVSSGCFAGWYLATIVQDQLTTPRDGKLVILGDGNAKAIFTDEDDIGTFTIKTIDDPRAENKSVHIRAKENILSTNEVIAKWEKLSGHEFEKEFLDKEAIFKSVEELTFPYNMLRGIKYSVFYKGEQTNFPLDPSKDLEATELYPDVKYTTADAYLARLV